MVVQLSRDIAESSRFQNFITGVILFAGVLVGIETYPGMVEQHGTVLHFLDKVVLWIFVAEIAVKMVAAWPRPWHFFRDPWNNFDFIIVAAAFLPFAGSAATVLRLVRLLRVLRLVRAVPKLQILVGALLKSIPSMGYVSVLLLLLFYVYAVAGVFMWGGNDPAHFGNLQIAFVTLFRTVTLEDWTDIMYTAMYGCDVAGTGYDALDAMCTSPAASPVGGAIYFVSFVLFGTMIVLNLFIGVILSGMGEAQKESEDQVAAARGGVPTLDDELRTLEQQIATMQEQVARVRRRRASNLITDRAPEGELPPEAVPAE